jgi:hypothetical protein
MPAGWSSMGPRPFEHDPQKSGSYFVTLENDKGEQPHPMGRRS